MFAEAKDAIDHWAHISPLLIRPKTEADYECLIEALDEVLDAGGADEEHPLASLANYLADFIEGWEKAKFTIPSEISGVEMLRYLMDQQGLKQSDLSEIGSQGVVSEILNGKRELNLHQIRKLADRFGVQEQVFI